MQTGLISGANARIGRAVTVHVAAEVSAWTSRRVTQYRVTRQVYPPFPGSDF